MFGFGKKKKQKQTVSKALADKLFNINEVCFDTIFEDLDHVNKFELHVLVFMSHFASITRSFHGLEQYFKEQYLEMLKDKFLWGFVIIRGIEDLDTPNRMLKEEKHFYTFVESRIKDYYNDLFSKEAHHPNHIPLMSYYYTYVDPMGEFDQLFTDIIESSKFKSKLIHLFQMLEEKIQLLYIEINNA